MNMVVCVCVYGFRFTFEYVFIFINITVDLSSLRLFSDGFFGTINVTRNGTIL